MSKMARWHWLYIYIVMYLSTIGSSYPINQFDFGASGRISPFVSQRDEARRLFHVDPSLDRPTLSGSSSAASLSPPATTSQRHRQELLPELQSARNRETMRSRAIDHLLDVFGMKNTSSSSGWGDHQNRVAPPFMVNLYNTMADSTSGVTFGQSPFNANTVRALPDRARKRLRFQFNLSLVEPREVLLQAELHLFRLKPRWKIADGKKPNFFQVHIYQLLSTDFSSTEDARLIGLRLMSSRSTGWEVFSIRDTVHDWLTNSSSNYGLYITVTSLSGQPLPSSLLRCVKKGRQDDKRQPILVLFTEDRIAPRKLPDTHEPHGQMEDGATYTSVEEPVSSIERQYPTASTRVFHSTPSTDDIVRQKRSLVTSKSQLSTTVQSAEQRKRHVCSRDSMYVNFDAIGWSSWIISPTGYNAYRCTGVCPFPLLAEYAPSNHATVQSIMNAMDADTDIAPPCCVPAELHPISLLYFDSDDNVVLKKIENMIVGTCGCH